MTDIPAPSNRKRVVLCMGEFCNLSRRSDKLYKKLQPLVAEANANGANIKLETARCLTMCGAGPNLIIYPDHIVFNQMDDSKLPRLTEELLKPNSES